MFLYNWGLGGYKKKTLVAHGPSAMHHFSTLESAL